MRNIIKICKEALYKCRNVTFQGGKTCHQKNVHRISRLICTFSALLSKISVCVCVCVFVCVCVHTHFSSVWLCATLWTVAYQACLSVGFSRQEYCSGLPCPPPRDLPNPEFKSTSLKYSALAGGFFTTSNTWEAQNFSSFCTWKFQSSWNKTFLKKEINDTLLDIKTYYKGILIIKVWYGYRRLEYNRDLGRKDFFLLGLPWWLRW